MTETQQILTPWYITPGQPYVKSEFHDPDVMDALLRDTKSFAAKDLRALSAYKKGRQHGNRVEVKYEFGKGCEADQVGRLYARGNAGLQAFPFDLRNPLLSRDYWDCDMENCHYWLLLRNGRDFGVPVAAIKRYCENRDEELAKVSSSRATAKTAFLKTAYGGSVKELNEDWGTRHEDAEPDGDTSLLKAIATELSVIRDLVWARHPELQKKVKKKPNAKNSALALFLQTEERKCLLTMERFLEAHGRKVDVLIHDGCCIRKADEAKFPEALLRGAEQAIADATGYTMRLAIKPMKHSFVMPARSEELIDDEFAARKFVELCGSHIQRDDERVLFFDENLGMWSHTDTAFRRAVQKHKKELIFKTMTPTGETILNYGGTERNVQAMSKWIKSCLEDTKFLSRNADTSFGKLLFADGIFDFDTGFTAGFDPSIVFTKRIDRPFPQVVDQALVDTVDRLLFVNAFDAEDGRLAGQYFKKALTMALFGDYFRRKFYLALGEASCGKGVTVGAMREAFCEYVAEFSANELLYNPRNGQDESRRLAWLKELAGARIAFSNELRMDGRAADGNLIKAISSGGDGHQVRNNYENSGQIINRTMIFVMANDFTKITPNPANDSGLKDRLSFIRYKLRFVENPTAADERQKDPAVKQKFKTTEYKDALFHLIWQTYNTMDEAEKKKCGDIYTPPCVKAETAEWVGDTEGSFATEVLAKYEVTHNPVDLVPCRNVINYLKIASHESSHLLV